MNNPEKAVEFFKGGRNCSQSVVSAFGPSCGLPAETCIRIAAPFGGGIGHIQETCGAVTGAIMILGMVHGAGTENRDARDGIIEKTREFIREFKKRHRTVRCRDLLGCDITTKAGLAAARDGGAFNACADYVQTAAEILDTML